MQTKSMSAVILAGGKSSRMGRNKMLMPLGDKPLIGHLVETVSALFAETIVVTDTPEDYKSFGVRTVQDKLVCPKKNALAGIHAGLYYARFSYVLAVAGDMPFVRPALLEFLCEQADGFDVTVPRDGPHLQPLCAVYHKNCLPSIEALCRRNHYKILDFFPGLRVNYVDDTALRGHDPDFLSFLNVNTPDDYRRARQLLDSGGQMEGDAEVPIPVVSIVGKSDSGKTTLLCGLIPELKRRGYKLATIKHDVHGFDIDKPGKDTWKHAEAGADTVVISSPWKVAMIEKVDTELTMDEVIAKISGVDIILTEGYKRNDKPKIEIFRSTVHDVPLCTKEDNMLAIASDIQPDLGVPVLAVDDYAGMADIIEKAFFKK